jgi:WD40 repeat protein
VQEFDMTRQEEPPTPLSDGKGPFEQQKQARRPRVPAALASAPPEAIAAYQQLMARRAKRTAGCFSRLFLVLFLLAAGVGAGFYLYHRSLESRMAKHLAFELEGFEDGVWDLEYSPDGRYLAARPGSSSSINEPALRIWDARTGHVLCEQPPMAAGVADFDLTLVQDMAFSPDSRSIALLTGEKIWIAPLPEARAWRAIPLTTVFTSMDALRFSPDGRYLALLSDGLVICSVETGATLFRYSSTGDKVESYRFTGDGALLFSSVRNDTLRVWRWRPDAGGEALFYSVMPSSYLPGQVAFAGDGRLVAYVDDSQLFVFDANEPSLLWKRKDDFSVPHLFAFSGDDSTLYVQRSSGGIGAWNSSDGRTRPGVRVRIAPLERLFFTLSDDRRLLFVTDLEDRAEVWNLRTRRRLRTVTHIDNLMQFASEVNVGALAPDGRHFATGLDKVRIWNLGAR